MQPKANNCHHSADINIFFVYLQLFLKVIIGFFVFHETVLEISPTIIEIPIFTLFLIVSFSFDRMKEPESKSIFFMEKVSNGFNGKELFRIG